MCAARSQFLRQGRANPGTRAGDQRPLSTPGAVHHDGNVAPGFKSVQGMVGRGYPSGVGIVPPAADPSRLHSGGATRQNAFESSGLVLRNPILLLSILAISGIACSGTSPATTPAATDFNRASCPGLKSRCLSGLGCRTSGSPPPHRQTGFWNHVASAAALAFRTSHARLAPSILLVFIANLRPNSNTLRSSRAMFSAGYG